MLVRLVHLWAARQRYNGRIVMNTARTQMRVRVSRNSIVRKIVPGPCICAPSNRSEIKEVHGSPLAYKRHTTTPLPTKTIRTPLFSPELYFFPDHMFKHQYAPALDQRMYYARLKALCRKSKGRHGGQKFDRGSRQYSCLQNRILQPPCPDHKKTALSGRGDVSYQGLMHNFR